ncbi:MAG: alanine--tRNA ligase [Promethearchaeota archaeon]
MLSDKEQKKAFKLVASRDPDRYYPTGKLRSLGFQRRKCRRCGTQFWTVNAGQDACGDPACSGGFRVVEDNPSKVKLSYVDVWNELVRLLEPRGYKPLKRYPVVARWNPTTEFTIASISAFQPYVISGESAPPAKKLLIPQFCLRFGDVENVGVTGSHLTGFVMIGQHAFVEPEEWDQEQLFEDILDFLLKVIRLPKEEITVHEDAWAGGGNFGPCMEFFSRGVELFNQVYMMFEQTPDGPKDLSIKVLDMGLGMERVAWFSQGTPNAYEATFPATLAKLREATGASVDFDLYSRFSRYAAYLNLDEVDSLDDAWERVAEATGASVEELREKVLPVTALYSVAEHSRALLFALSDGMLPSNVGGGYNLRVIFRRAMGFVDRFGWDLNLADACEWHAEELRPIFPEVSEHLDDVRAVLDVELKKYRKSKQKARSVVKSVLRRQQVTPELLVQLYDSNGITPDLVKEVARERGVLVTIPENFYGLVVARHERTEQAAQTHRERVLDLGDHPPTTALYYDDYALLECEATVLAVSGPHVVLDRTVAYPTSGGQLHDLGEIVALDGGGGEDNERRGKIVDVFKQGGLIVHQLDADAPFEPGDGVKVTVDRARRLQLAQHHTATHVVNAAARNVLGNHVNQAGAKKTEERATLDVTHFANVTADQLAQIEAKANEIVAKNLPVVSKFMSRREAEDKFGMRIYQGGAVPGNDIRIVDIPGVDVEACGGTHLHETGEVGRLKLLGARKVQDGVVRLSFTAGGALRRWERRQRETLERCAETLDVSPEGVASAALELLEKWKVVQKALKTGEAPPPEAMKLRARAGPEKEGEEGDGRVPSASELADALGVKLDELPGKISKMLEQWKSGVERATSLASSFDADALITLKESEGERLDDVTLLVHQFPGLQPKELQRLAVKFATTNDDVVVFFATPGEKGVHVVAAGNSGLVARRGWHLGNVLRDVVGQFGGRGGGRTDNGQGVVPPGTSVAEVLAAASEALRGLATGGRGK